MKNWRQYLLFLSMVGMIAALFFSRGILSGCMAAFFILSFSHRNIRSHFLKFFSSPVLWSMSLLLLLPLLSGLWSSDNEEWLETVRIKLPLLILPLAFAGPFSFCAKQWNFLAGLFIALVVTGTIWSMFQYAENIETINDSYLRAKTLDTPFRGDHIRFSWVVSIAILLTGWMWWKNKQREKIISIILLLIAVWLTIFLHILAARTGLLSFYIMLFITAVVLIARKTRPLQGAMLLLLVLLLPVLAYFTLPSFHNRVEYILYDYEYFKEMRYLPGGNDANRMISLRAGWQVLNEHPLLGTGTGDMYPAVKEWSRHHYPGIHDHDILYPCSEWIIYGLTAGWLGLLIFTACMLIPFFSKRKPYLVWALLNFTAAFSFLFDIGLEVQFGVFVYSFIVLWWWKWFEPDKVRSQSAVASWQPLES